MSTEQQARSIKVSLTVNGKKKHPTQIILKNEINSWPQLRVVYHYDRDAYNNSIQLSSDQIAREMGQVQTKMFTVSASQTTIKLKVQADKGGSLTFKGISVQPSYGFSVHSVERTDVAVVNYAALDLLSGACYSITKADNWEKEAPKLEDVGTVPELIWRLYQWMQKQWLKEQDGEDADSFSKKYKNKQHTNNKKIEKYFKQILSRSVTSFGWDQLKTWLESPHDNKMRERILTLLSSASGNFLSIINKFGEEYQEVYAPEWEKPGRYIGRDKLFKHPQTYKATIVSLFINAGTQGMLPSRYVAVKPPADVNGDQWAGNIEGYISYPENMKDGGTVLIKQSPPWMPGTLYKEELPEEGGVDQKKGLNASSAQGKRKKYKQERKKTKKKKMRAVKQWAKSCYIWDVLGPAWASIKIPLDLKPKVGMRYRVQNDQGRTLFEGFLKSIEHNISADGNTANAFTTMQFTHIKMIGASIPGVN